MRARRGWVKSRGARVCSLSARLEIRCGFRGPVYQLKLNLAFCYLSFVYSVVTFLRDLQLRGFFLHLT